ncbi:DODA-type extradiol aromatic ring-opening family dioxygenase [Alkanindiges sp. WGS2144]|uniref:DODA-type extradiol aromatic ring-opening family dioxygenase n=1 Tax=Alkanindiges sp. WGS2144 TaxID=3366808 RepID=UPI0037533B47
MSISTLPGLFISHGSPMLAIEPEQIGPALHRLSINLPRPNAIVVMSAHWESQALEISSHNRPETWHDFSGFPRELYQIHYPAPGSIQLAERMLDMLQQAGIEAHANSLRPRDHGVWMPLLHLYPEADIPVVQISLPTGRNALQLFQIGQALAPLRTEQILLIGSGSITHNLAELSWSEESVDPPEWATAFRNWVVHQLSNDNFAAVLNWPQAPFVHRNHPTLEHLAPLFFAMGTGSRFSLIHSSFSLGALGMDLYRFD